MSARTTTYWRVEVTTPDDPNDYFDMYECGTRKTAIKHAIRMLKYHRVSSPDCYARLSHIQHTVLSEKQITETGDDQ